MKRTKKRTNRRVFRKSVSRKRISRKRVYRKRNKTIKKVGGSDGSEGEGSWGDWITWALGEANKQIGKFAQSYTQQNPMREAGLINNMVIHSGQLGGEIRSKNKIK